MHQMAIPPRWLFQIIDAHLPHFFEKIALI
jgi:hypothetical protein